jgi:hypothetical protein
LSSQAISALLAWNKTQWNVMGKLEQPNFGNNTSINSSHYKAPGFVPVNVFLQRRFPDSMAPSTIILAAVATFGANVLAQTKYGENHVRVSFDSDIVVKGAFPEPNATLLSPAFLPDARFDPGWEEGTEGATDEKTLGNTSSVRLLSLIY